VKDIFVVGFNFPPERWRLAQALFRNIGRDGLAQEPKAEFGYTLTFYSEIELTQFWKEAEAVGFSREHGFERRDRRFSDRELVTAPLVRLAIDRAPRGFGGPQYGTQYDLSGACRRCGTGALQLGPLVLRAAEIGPQRGIFQTLDDEVLLGRDLARTLSEARLSGHELLQTVGYPNGAPLQYFQLLARQELPPMLPSDSFVRDRQCPECGRDGYFSYPRGSRRDQVPGGHGRRRFAGFRVHLRALWQLSSAGAVH
jgi:hypothetical protein